MSSAEFQSSLADTVARLRRTFQSGVTRRTQWRREQLRALQALLTDRSSELCEALWTDLHKPALEVDVTEAGFVIGEIKHALAHLADWLKPGRVGVPLVHQPASACILHEPLGVVLIIGAWNYPVHVLLAPLVGALAGGNTALLKPSEISAATSSTLARLIPGYLDREVVAVVEGGPEETETLLDEPFDHIFFTGSAGVGRIVLAKAARRLTPVTLELGSKSPCLVDRDADLAVAARRIAWGKFTNAGQTCVAPDYVLAHEQIAEPLCAGIRDVIREFYGDDPSRSDDYGRIVSARHHARLARFLGDGEVYCGGQADLSRRYIAPTILRNVSPEAPVMQEEIFGPILPVPAVADMDAAIDFVNARPKPLVVYLFSESQAAHDAVVERTSSGDVCINDVMLHLSVPELPFGGVGGSGMGRYHGRYSFDTFTHAKGILRKSVHLDVSLRYPPYSERQRRWVNRLMRFGS